MSENHGNHENQGNRLMAGFLFGAVVGAGAALLLAPASGRDTRRRIREKAVEIRGKAGRITESARGRLHEMSHSMREGARELTSAVKEGRDAFQRAADDPTLRP